MSPRIVLISLTFLTASGQIHGQADFMRRVRVANQQLTYVLEWEILWKISPIGFKFPKDSALVNIFLGPDFLSYCSSDLGSCVKYSISGFRNWQAVRTEVCCGNTDSKTALRSFVEADGSPLGQIASRRQRSGILDQASGIEWEELIRLHNRAQMIDTYKRLKPKNLESIGQSLKSELRDDGYKTLMIACYRETDPLVYIYGERTNGPIVFAVFWDSREQSWIDGGVIATAEHADVLEDFKATIKLVSCTTITFAK